MGSLSAGEMMAAPTIGMSEVDLDAVRKDCEDRSRRELTATVAALEAAGASVGSSTVITGPPIDSLAEEGPGSRWSGGDHPDPSACGRRVLPPRLDLPGPPEDRRARAAPSGARELRRAGRRRRGRGRSSDRRRPRQARPGEVREAPTGRGRRRPKRSRSAPPTPPRGAPVAAFAGVLDGRSLWLAIDARPGSLALRDAASGDVIALAGQQADDQPAYRGARLDLGELRAGTEAAYDVVVVPSSGRSPKPVWTHPLPPTVAPVVDGARWDLRRGDDGTLRLVRAAVPAGGRADRHRDRRRRHPSGHRAWWRARPGRRGRPSSSLRSATTC